MRVVSAVYVVVICVAMLGVAGCTGSEGASSTSSSATSSTAASPEATTSVSDGTSSSVPLAASAIEALVRPIVDPEVCESFAAIEGEFGGQIVDPDGSPRTFFARPSEQPVPILILATPTDGPAGGFAFIQRFFDGDDLPTNAASVIVGETEFLVRALDNGNGEVGWMLEDGSQGYLRSRGLGHDELVEIVSALSPRSSDAIVPGFDYRQPADSELEVMVDQLNTDPVTGTHASSGCRVAATGDVYSISLFSGAELFQYASVIDRPPPLAVGYRGDTVIIVAGPDTPGAPRVDDIVNADADTWQRLRSGG